MTNICLPIEEHVDLETLNVYQERIAEGYDPEQVMASIHARSRDNARTPMQWDASENAGFTTGKPWLKVNPNYREINVADQQERADSVLSYYKQLLRLRKSDEVFTYGGIEPVFMEHDTVMAYVRAGEGKRVLVAANFGTEPVTLDASVKQVLLENMPIATADTTVCIPACGVLVAELL